MEGIIMSKESEEIILQLNKIFRERLEMNLDDCNSEVLD